MPGKKPAKKKYVSYHNDGSVHAKGSMVDGKPDGYFEWFRIGGTKMRSGYFEKGKPVGEWTTYDRNGRIVKVTRMK